ncbi:S1 RNA-binding domain-containing protein, partial [Patescibacteria group bacterium]|nr:S1 RNA-binding domain-containing protein [Patescibacteria group bacterium]
LEDKKKNGEALDGFIGAETRGGFLIETEIGVSGFMPNSQSQASNKTGDRLKVFVADLNRDGHRVIFSQRPLVGDKEFEELSSRLKAGTKVKAEVTNILPFGIFTSVQTNGKTLNGFIHISEVSWERQERLDNLFKIGDSLEAVVIGFDNSTQRVNLSLRLLTADSFEKTAEERFPVDTKIKAKVSKIVPAGVLFDLDEASGIIKKESIPIGTAYKVGDTIETTVSKVDKKKRQIILVPILLEKPIGYR